MTTGTEAALELDLTHAGNVDADVHFSNFPGVWQPGRPIAVTELGFATAAEAAEKVKELGLPLTVVDVHHGSAPMPARHNHVASEEQARAIDNAVSETGFKTHAAANAAAEAAGVEWPSGKMTLADKQAFLESYSAGKTDETGDETSPSSEEGDG